MDRDVNRVNKAAGFVVDLRRAAEEIPQDTGKKGGNKKRRFFRDALAFLKSFYQKRRERKKDPSVDLSKAVYKEEKQRTFFGRHSKKKKKKSKKKKGKKKDKKKDEAEKDKEEKPSKENIPSWLQSRFK